MTSLAALRNTVLVTTMVTTAFQIFVFAVLASTFIADFGLTRLELGLVGSLNVAVGAVTAPFTGTLTDKFGARNTAVVAQLICAAGFVVMASASSVVMLLVSAVMAGIPQGMGNPITNTLIGERVEPGRRGTVTGIKQSGVQLGIFLSGVTLPWLNEAIGWRAGLRVYAVVFVLFAMLPLALPAKPSVDWNVTEASAPTARGGVSRYIWQLTFYAFAMGTAGGAIGRFLALFAEEEVGMSNTTAGLVLALSGLVGIAARIVAGRLAEQRGDPLHLLALLAVIGAMVSLLLMAASSVGAWILWPIALLFAIGHSAWNAVAMLAIIMHSPAGRSGRASGVVMFGFLGGLAVGPPIAGLLIDATGSYLPLWILATALAITGAVTAQAARGERPRITSI